MKSLLVGCLMMGGVTVAAAATSEFPNVPGLHGQTVQCADFKANPDGSWTTLHAITVQRMNEYTAVAEDTTFRAGEQRTVGLDVGAVLDQACPR